MSLSASHMSRWKWVGAICWPLVVASLLLPWFQLALPDGTHRAIAGYDLMHAWAGPAPEARAATAPEADHAAPEERGDGTSAVDRARAYVRGSHAQEPEQVDTLVAEEPLATMPWMLMLLVASVAGTVFALVKVQGATWSHVVLFLAGGLALFQLDGAVAELAGRSVVRGAGFWAAAAMLGAVLVGAVLQLALASGGKRRMAVPANRPALAPAGGSVDAPVAAGVVMAARAAAAVKTEDPPSKMHGAKPKPAGYPFEMPAPPIAPAATPSSAAGPPPVARMAVEDPPPAVTPAPSPAASSVPPIPPSPPRQTPVANAPFVPVTNPYPPVPMIIGKSIAPCEQEVSVRSYVCSQFNSGFFGIRAKGILEVTNKRLIFQALGEGVKGWSVIHNEVAIMDVADIKVYKGSSFNLKLFLLGIMLTILVTGMLVKALGEAMKPWLALLLCLAGAIYFIVKVLYPWCRKDTFSLVVNTKGGGGNVVFLAGQSPFGSGGTAASAALMAGPGPDSEKLMKEIGAVVNDIQSLGDFGIEKWKKMTS